MVVMKKLIILIFLCVLGVFIFSSFNVKKAKDNNTKLTKEIVTFKKKNDNIAKDNIEYKTEIDNLENELKDELKELEVWEKTQKKLKETLDLSK